MANGSSRPAELFGLGQPASPRARLWDLAICLQYVPEGCTLHQRLLGAVCFLQFEHRGSPEALGLDILSAVFLAWVRHDRPTAAKHTSYEHRLSDEHANPVSFPVEKDPFARKQGKHMSVTLNQQAMEHAMASRPAITDPVRPASGKHLNLRVLRR